MEKSAFTKWALILLMMLLSMNMGNRLLPASSDAEVREKIQYKVVSTKTVKTGAEYEELLNRMANAGWVFDHFIELADLAVFRRSSSDDPG